MSTCVEYQNRYVWTDFGPVMIWSVARLTPAKTRRICAANGYKVERFARNHMEFWGWAIREVWA